MQDISKDQIDQVKALIKSNFREFDSSSIPNLYDILTEIRKRDLKYKTILSMVPILSNIIVVPLIAYLTYKNPSATQYLQLCMIKYYLCSALFSALFSPPSYIFKEPYYSEWLKQQSDLKLAATREQLSIEFPSESIAETLISTNRDGSFDCRGHHLSKSEFNSIAAAVASGSYDPYTEDSIKSFIVLSSLEKQVKTIQMNYKEAAFIAILLTVLFWIFIKCLTYTTGYNFAEYLWYSLGSFGLIMLFLVKHFSHFVHNRYETTVYKKWLDEQRENHVFKTDVNLRDKAK